MQLAWRLIDPRASPPLGGDINFSRVMLNNEIFIISRTGAVSEKKFANCMSLALSLSLVAHLGAHQAPRSGGTWASFIWISNASANKEGWPVKAAGFLTTGGSCCVCVCDLLVRTMLSGSCRFSRRSHFSHRGEHQRGGKGLSAPDFSISGPHSMKKSKPAEKSGGVKLFETSDWRWAVCQCGAKDATRDLPHNKMTSVVWKIVDRLHAFSLTGLSTF